jgi:hypothetical protein
MGGWGLHRFPRCFPQWRQLRSYGDKFSSLADWRKSTDRAYTKPQISLKDILVDII